MDIKITPYSLNGEIKAISSKSDAHRVMICAALADSKTIIKTDNSSSDIRATLSCIESMGATVQKSDEFITITPAINPTVAPTLDCFESGSTLRFLLPVASVLCENPTFIGRGRLPQRPLSPLLEEMEKHGCSFTEKTLPFSVCGKLTGGTYHLPGNISSQYISGLLFALPLCKQDSKIVLTTPLESKGYVNMTLSTLKLFGIKIEETKNEYIIKENQKYISPKEITIEGDWSNAAFWLCSAAIDGAIKCTNLRLDSNQGDKGILSVLQSFGANVTAKEDEVFVSKGTLNGIELDCTNIPDLVPIISAVAAVSNGTTILKGTSRLRLKESDRLFAICSVLTSLGADVKIQNDSLIINGKTELTGGTIDSFNDHRIAMMAAILATKCRNPVVIRNFEAVDKSYPDFLNHYKSLGGVFDVI